MHFNEELAVTEQGIQWPEDTQDVRHDLTAICRFQDDENPPFPLFPDVLHDRPVVSKSFAVHHLPALATEVREAGEVSGGQGNV